MCDTWSIYDRNRDSASRLPTNPKYSNSRVMNAREAIGSVCVSPANIVTTTSKNPHVTRIASTALITTTICVNRRIDLSARELPENSFSKIRLTESIPSEYIHGSTYSPPSPASAAIKTLTPICASVLTRLFKNARAEVITPINLRGVRQEDIKMHQARFANQPVINSCCKYDFFIQSAPRIFVGQFTVIPGLIHESIQSVLSCS